MTLSELEDELSGAQNDVTRLADLLLEAARLNDGGT